MIILPSFVEFMESSTYGLLYRLIKQTPRVPLEYYREAHRLAKGYTPADLRVQYKALEGKFAVNALLKEYDMAYANLAMAIYFRLICEYHPKIKRNYGHREYVYTLLRELDGLDRFMEEIDRAGTHSLKFQFRGPSAFIKLLEVFRKATLEVINEHALETLLSTAPPSCVVDKPVWSPLATKIKVITWDKKVITHAI